MSDWRFLTTGAFPAHLHLCHLLPILEQRRRRLGPVCLHLSLHHCPHLLHHSHRRTRRQPPRYLCHDCEKRVTNYACMMYKFLVSYSPIEATLLWRYPWTGKQEYCQRKILSQTKDREFEFGLDAEISWLYHCRLIYYFRSLVSGLNKNAELW